MQTKKSPLFLIWVGVVLGAQGAEVAGVVRDGSGGVVPGAVVELTDSATERMTVASTDREGQYRFAALGPGNYGLFVSRAGFTPVRRDRIGLRTGDRVVADFVLRVGEVSFAVGVGAPLLQVSDGTVSFVLEQKKVVNLPLNERNFVPLLVLSPGVSLPPGSLFPRINGSRPRVSEYLYDGVSVLQPEPGQVAYFPVLDAIEEFRVETNSYSAEFGRSNGGVIIVHQKTGTNEFRGTVFEFFRNERLNSRNYFAPPGPKPRFRRNQYGFVFGGPIQKNRTFFFADWQGTRLNTGVTRTSNVPTEAQRRGVFSQPIFDPATTRRTDRGYAREAFAGNMIPLSRFDPAARRLIERYPSPNAGAGQALQANNYKRVGEDISGGDQLDGRLDHYLSVRHRFFGRYSFFRDDSRPASPLPDGSGAINAGVTGHTVTRSDSIAAEHTWNPTTAAVNQVRFGHTQRSFHRDSLRMGEPASLLTGIPQIPAASFSDVLPTFDLVGFQQLGAPGGSNAAVLTSVTQFFDVYSWVKGRHTLKIGADIRRQALNGLQPSNPTGNFQFNPIFTAALSPGGAVVPNTGSSFGSFLLGQVGRFTLDAQPRTIRPRAGTAEFFVQDSWRAKRRLSLTLGVRYTLNLPSTVVGDEGAVFNLATQKLDYLGKNGVPRSARDLEKLNFGPRVGVAYQASESLVLRSGYGMTWIDQAGITTPFTTPLLPFIQTIGQQTLDNIHPAFLLSHGPSVRIRATDADAGLGQGVFGVQRNNGSGYAQQWNFSVQKSFGPRWSVEAGYLGSKLTRLGVPDVNLNQLTVAQLTLGPQLTLLVPNPFAGEIPAGSPLGSPTLSLAQLLRPYPRFTTVALYRNNIGHSTYHSFQSRLERRFSTGLALSAAYTFSRLIDDAGAVFDAALLAGPVSNVQAADSFNKRLEKDVSTGNLPHNLSTGFVYDVPAAGSRFRRLTRGWRLSGIARIQSGSPLPVTQATNLNAFAGFGIQRPNRIIDPTLPASERDASGWFNRAAFAAAPQFTLGSSSRNPVTGPGFRTLDAALSRSEQITERVRAEVRVEAFNLMNTPLLGAPNTSAGNAAFGTISTALDPRVIELAVKLHF